jgi:hypothetical protein
MIARALRAPSRSGRFWDGMGIIESYEALIAGLMQRKRVGDSMRPLLRHRDAPRLEFHPVTGLIVNHVSNAIQIEQRFQARIKPDVLLHVITR